MSELENPENINDLPYVDISFTKQQSKEIKMLSDKSSESIHLVFLFYIQHSLFFFSFLLLPRSSKSYTGESKSRVNPSF